MLAAARALLPRAGDRAAARLEAEVLLASVLGCRRAALLTLDELADEDAAAASALVDRRLADGCPVAYLTGRREFHELTLAVDRRVLIPRPETERLLEVFEGLDAAGLLPAGAVVDWGTGSGAVALVAARRRPVLAIDCSAAALEVARANVEGAGPGEAAVRSRVQPSRQAILLLRADGLSALAAGSLAAVLANPPYVEPQHWAGLPDDVRHEPRGALVPADGDVTGLYARLGAEARRTLLSGGWLLAEIGQGQGDRVAAAWTRAGLVVSQRLRDLSGIERVIVARRC